LGSSNTTLLSIRKGLTVAKIINHSEDCTFLTVKPYLIEEYNQFVLSFIDMGYRVNGCFHHYLSFEKDNGIVNLLIPMEYYLRGNKNEEH